MSLNSTHYHHKQSKNIPIASSLCLVFSSPQILPWDHARYGLIANWSTVGLYRHFIFASGCIFFKKKAQLATDKQQLSAGSQLAISGRAKLFSNEGSCFSVSYTHKPALVLNSCHVTLCELAISHAFHFNTSHISSFLFKYLNNIFKISGLRYTAVRSLFVRDVAWPGQVVG